MRWLTELRALCVNNMAVMVWGIGDDWTAADGHSAWRGPSLHNATLVRENKAPRCSFLPSFFPSVFFILLAGKLLVG